MPKKPLAPSTTSLYRRTLDRAFGPDHTLKALSGLPPFVSQWARSTKLTLAAALARSGRKDLADQISIPYEIQREVHGPDEEEAQKYETAAALLQRGPRAIALLPLRLGMRAEEVLSLTRAQVQTAVKTGRLTFKRKGGRERTLPAEKVSALLSEMLEARPKAPRPKLHGPKTKRRARWETAGEIISLGSVDSQCRALRRLVVETGKEAGIAVRPHLLRHAFATRMSRDGAPLATIGAALDHRDLKTTARYVNPSEADINRFIRG